MNNLGYLRYGISAGKKIGKAVRRNRTKRVIREILREKLKTIRAGCDIVLVAKEGIINLRFAELKSYIQDLLRRANLLND